MSKQATPLTHAEGECCVCMETKQLIQTCTQHVALTCKTCLLNPSVRKCPVCRGVLPTKEEIQRALVPLIAGAKRPRAVEPIRPPGTRVIIHIYSEEERRSSREEHRRVRRRRNEAMHEALEAAARVQHQDEIMARNLQDRFDREQPAVVQIREDEEVARQLQRDEEGSDEDSDEPVLPQRRVLRFCSCNNPGCPWRGFNQNN